MNVKTRENTCCFTGHRAEKLPWKYNEADPECLRLKDVILDVLGMLYDEGFRHFICGMATGADMYFGEAVIDLRAEHPDVTLEAAVPFAGQERSWPLKARLRYARLAEACNERTVLSDAYTRSCMLERNRYMVDHSSVLVAVYDGRPGGTKYTIRYAVSQGVGVIQIPPFMTGA